VTDERMAAHEELIRAEHDWMDAWRRLDEPQLRASLADEFTLTSARTDQLMTKPQWLELALSGRVIGESFEFSDVNVHVYGEVAVVKSRMRQQASVDGRAWNETFMLTDVWVRRDGRWQVVARHSSTPPTRSFTS
jgi:ketosteroid isomerase-like protein